MGNSMKSGLAMMTSLFFAAVGPSTAASNAEKMAQRASASQLRDGEYANVAIKAFWGDVSFMSECVPAGQPVTAPFDIYFEVLPNGSLGAVVLDPKTNTGECIKRHVMHHKFPAPPGGAYVTKIEMQFKP